MTNKPLKIIYMGTPDFSVPALQTLIDSDHEVVAVYTQPPRPKGRGQKIQKSPVHLVAEHYNIPVYSPKSLKPKKNPDAVMEFQSHDADIAIVAAYGLILPQVILDATKYGCLNIHASLLPRWRGAAPIQYSVWKGDTQSGVTIMQMEAGLDTGPMMAKEVCDITPETTTQILHDQLSQMGGGLLLPLLYKYSKGVQPDAEIQDDTLTNYASMLNKEDGKIDWALSGIEIDRQIRALNPWPGTYGLNSEGNILKVKTAQTSEETSTQPIGTILNKNGNIVCGNGTVISLVCVQSPNKQAMDFTSALNGGYISVGDVLQ